MMLLEITLRSAGLHVKYFTLRHLSVHMWLFVFLYIPSLSIFFYRYFKNEKDNLPTILICSLCIAVRDMDELTLCKGSSTSKKRNNCVNKSQEISGMRDDIHFMSVFISSFMFSWVYYLIVLKMFWIVIFPNCKICREDLSLLNVLKTFVLSFLKCRWMELLSIIVSANPFPLITDNRPWLNCRVVFLSLNQQALLVYVNSPKPEREL